MKKYMLHIISALIILFIVSILLSYRVKLHLNCAYNNRWSCIEALKQVQICFDYYIEHNDDDNFDENITKASIIDKWGNPVEIIKSSDRILLRSYGLNGIDDHGEVDDVTVSFGIEGKVNFKRKISGYTKLHYWRYFPFALKNGEGRHGSYAFWELLFMLLDKPGPYIR